jgi:hypothetical protein
MKTNVPGIIITCIITFNIFCLIAYFVLKTINASRKSGNENEVEPDANEEKWTADENNKPKEEK